MSSEKRDTLHCCGNGFTVAVPHAHGLAGAAILRIIGSRSDKPPAVTSCRRRGQHIQQSCHRAERRRAFGQQGSGRRKRVADCDQFDHRVKAFALFQLDPATHIGRRRVSPRNSMAPVEVVCEEIAVSPVAAVRPCNQLSGICASNLPLAGRAFANISVRLMVSGYSWR